MRYLRVHEITHDREPFTPEEIEGRQDQDLIEDALQLRRQVLYKKLEKAKWAEIHVEALKWRKVEESILMPLLAAIRENPPEHTVPQIKVSSEVTPYMAVIGLTDLHFGKYSDEKENFESYSMQEARDRLMSSTADVLGRMSYFGRPERLLAPVGSDFVHIDNDAGASTRGTPQDTDGTPGEILVGACRLMVDWVDMLRTMAPVELVLMSGNHDRILGLSVLLYLHAYYRDVSGVTVSLDRTPRVYRAYGKNLIGFAHGDTVSKTQELAGLMSTEAREHWSQCSHRTIYTGHLHMERSETDSTYGVTRRQIAAISGPDRWHTRNGYVGAPRSLPAYLHERERGLVAVLHAPV